MSVSIGAPVSAPRLTTVRELGVGGQGTVTLVEAPELFPGQLAFKEYPRATLEEADVALLGRLVGLPARAGDELRTLLDERAAWPVATVHRGDAVCGFLMRPAPAEYLAELRLPDGRRPHLLAMEFLLNPPEYMWSIDLQVTERMRLGLLRELAGMLAVLHRERIIVGDLSPKNILVALRPPRCFLLDCDAMRVAGESVLPQFETPDWRLPAGEELATPASDRYKFGLLAVRLLLADQAAGDPGPLRAIPALVPLADLAARSLAAPPVRPDWNEWLTALDAALPLASDALPAPPALPVSAPPTTTPPMPPFGPRPAPPRPAGTGWTGAKTFALVMAVTAVLVLLLCVAANGGGESEAGPTGRTDQFTTGEGTPGYQGDTGSGAPAGPTPERPDGVGIVGVHTANDDPNLIAVAGFFDRYFRAINDKDWAAVLSLYAPEGVIDPGDERHRASFIKAMSTTRDEDIHVVSVDSTVDPVIARVRFVSNQSRGYGPKNRPDETCTRWDVTYALTRHGDDYRVYRPQRARNQPC
ncbi:hypothetical protein [Phytohabitans kaempferiae]|uniref:Protein kinase domain-containing protein n=1 Tax=Phytohabitans kaempferiae TaxID=1620943 RepID=A0ABV6MF23_9ACTN